MVCEMGESSLNRANENELLRFTAFLLFSHVVYIFGGKKIARPKSFFHFSEKMKKMKKWKKKWKKNCGERSIIVFFTRSTIPSDIYISCFKVVSRLVKYLHTAPLRRYKVSWNNDAHLFFIKRISRPNIKIHFSLLSRWKIKMEKKFSVYCN